MKEAKVKLTLDNGDFNKKVDETTSRFRSTSSGINQLDKSTSQVTNTLINFRYVISDLPYGLRGVGNNISPLLNSFNSLTAASGGVIGSFRAIGSSLTGPFGLLLLGEGLISLFTILEMKNQGVERGNKDLEKSYYDLSKGVREYTISLRDLNGENKQYIDETLKDQLELTKKQITDAENKLPTVFKTATSGFYGAINRGDLEQARINLENTKNAGQATKNALASMENLLVLKLKEKNLQAQINDGLAAEVNFNIENVKAIERVIKGQTSFNNSLTNSLKSFSPDEINRFIKSFEREFDAVPFTVNRAVVEIKDANGKVRETISLTRKELDLLKYTLENINVVEYSAVQGKGFDSDWRKLPRPEQIKAPSWALQKLDLGLKEIKPDTRLFEMQQMDKLQLKVDLLSATFSKLGETIADAFVDGKIKLADFSRELSKTLIQLKVSGLLKSAIISPFMSAAGVTSGSGPGTIMPMPDILKNTIGGGMGTGSGSPVKVEIAASLRKSGNEFVADFKQAERSFNKNVVVYNG